MKNSRTFLAYIWMGIGLLAIGFFIGSLISPKLFYEFTPLISFLSLAFSIWNFINNIDDL